MFGKMKDAARQAQAERHIRDILTEETLADGASVNIRLVDGKMRATVILADGAPISGEAVGSLEATMQTRSGADAVTVVATVHRNAAAEQRQRSGHDNPLAIPGGRKVTEADRSGALKARPQRQRPGNAARVIAVASGKGGVGKSTIAARLALALADRGGRVGLLDLDIYGPSLPVLFGLDGVRPRIDEGMICPLNAHGISLMSIGFLVAEEQALAWRGPMVMGAAKQLLDEVKWPPLDWLIIDTPPGTGDAHLTLMQRTRIDGALIVSTPSPLAVADVRRGASLFRKMDVPLLGLVENMAELPGGALPFGPGIDEETLVGMGLPKLLRLPLDEAFSAMLTRSKPAAGPFDELVTAIDGRLSALDQDDKAP